MDSAVRETLRFLDSKVPAYVCVTDAGNIVNAYKRFPELKHAINESGISLPDGRPVSLLAKLKGIREIERVAGPDFMEEMFRRTAGTDLKHFFLGDTEETLSKLKEKILCRYKINIAGTYSPPFGEWSDELNSKIASSINEANADLIWVGLGGTKQEIWMKNNYEKLNKGLMIGVGAAFRFFTGDIKRAPAVFQKASLEWMFRLMQQPGKMFVRYSKTLPYFFFYSIQELIGNNSKNKLN